MPNPSQPLQDQPRRDFRARLVRFAALAAAGVAVAAATVAVVAALAPPAPNPGPDEVAAEPASAPSPPATHGARVRLPEIAVPAGVEALQQEAEQAAGDLLAQYPSLPEALHVAAMMHAQFRQSAKAEMLWRKCLELAPKDDRYSVNLAAIALERGDTELAAETLQKAVEAGSRSPDVLHHLGVALMNLGRSEEAVDVIEKALAAYPRSSSHWLVLGQAQLKLGRAAEAEQSLERAIELGAHTATTFFALAGACARQGKHEEAAAHRATFADLSSGDSLAAQERFQILSTAEARRTAVAILTEAATVHARQGNTLESERLLLRALALDPSSAASADALANVYREAGMTAEERVVRERLIQLDPHNFVRYLVLAKLSAELGEAEVAEAALKLALALEPQAADGYAALAEFYLEQGQNRQARWYIQEAVRRAPTAEGYQLLAHTCRLLGDDAGASAAFAMAGKLAPEEAPSPQRRASHPR